MRLTVLRAQDAELLKHVPADVVVNVASMQEMNHTDIAVYFKSMRTIARSRTVYFYCCNRAEKRLPDGTVNTFSDYPWDPGDEAVTDGLCPWHQHYYKVLPPQFCPYDGPHRHRLVKLAQAT